MYARQLDLQNFRSYTYAQLMLTQNTNLILGTNAAGKTSILEAFALFAQGRSIRATQDKDVIQFGQTECRMRLEMVRDKITTELAMKIDTKGKQVKVNRVAKKSLTEFLGHVYAVTFTPDDLDIVKGGPEARRRFINISMAQYIYGYVRHLHEYNQLLAKRNQLLKMRQLETIPIWDVQLSTAAAHIITARREFCLLLNTYTQNRYLRVSGQQDRAEVVYQTNVQGNTEDEIKSSTLSALKKALPQDQQRGFTSIGPHRDDIQFKIEERSAARFGSQGQQRSLVLALKMAVVDMIQTATGEWPLLLLDDVLSELDENRQQQLLTQLGTSQTIITATHWPETLEKKTAQVFRVSHGILQGE